MHRSKTDKFQTSHWDAGEQFKPQVFNTPYFTILRYLITRHVSQTFFFIYIYIYFFSNKETIKCSDDIKNSFNMERCKLWDGRSIRFLQGVL